MSEVIWRDPPDFVRFGPRTQPSIWQRKLTPLMEQPGRWALVHQGTKSAYSSVVRHQIKRGRMRLPEGTTIKDWEFTSRKTDDGTYDTYARFIGKRKR